MSRWENANSEPGINSYKLWKKQLDISLKAAKKTPDKLLVLSELILAGIDRPAIRIFIAILALAMINLLLTV